MAELLNDRERERFKAHQLLAKGKSIKFVANKLHRDVQWVRRTERRFEELGHFKDRAKSGKPKKLNSRDTKRLVKQVKGKERRSTRKMAHSFQTKDKKKVSRETIRRTLKTAGLYPHRKRKVTLLTEDHKKRRVAFAEKYRRADWNTYAFWDETESELVPTPNRKNDIIWDEKGVEYRQGQVAHPASFKYGVAITVHGPTRLVPYTGTIDAPKYKEMIKQVIPDLKKMFGKTEWTWVHDGARPHIAKTTLEFLSKKVPSVLPKKDWPANSPDLSPIEYANGYVDSEVQGKKSSSMRILEDNVRKEWKKLTPEYCRNLINGLSKRLKQVIETKGEYVYEVND